MSPDVGPNVESDAGEPASPKAAAIPINKMIAGTEKPKCNPIGIYMDAITGMVPKEVPIPIVISNPTISITMAPTNFESIIVTVADTKCSTEFVSRNTLA